MTRQPIVSLRALVVIPMAVVVVLLLTSSVPAMGGAGATESATDESGVIVYEVTAGDTLWDIAAAHTPRGADIRLTVVTIRRTNHLDTSTIAIGQILHLPTG